jgi:hypothetical protein
LALDLIKGEHALFAKQLKSCIGWQTPKWRGICYRGALHSPVELFMMAFKKTFYIPSFTSTAMDPSKMIFNECPNYPMPHQGYQNVIFEIDTSEFPNFTTVLNGSQSQYDESENLISCYNIFSWVGFRVVSGIKIVSNQKTTVVNGIPVITLKIENYNVMHNVVDQCLDGDHNSVDGSWFETRVRNAKRIKLITPKTLIDNFKEIIESYNRNFGKTQPLTWLNANYTPIHDPLIQKGHRLNGKEFSDLEKTQPSK